MRETERLQDVSEVAAVVDELAAGGQRIGVGLSIPRHFTRAGEDPFASVRWTTGLVDVVRFEGRPAEMSDEDVGRLQARMDALDGDAFMALKPGEPVQIVEGPFAGLDAVFERRLSADGRVAVLLRILGRQTRATLPGEAVERRTGR